MLLALALLSVDAQAFESETQELQLSDTVILFTDSTVDTDWLPSGSPLAVRFQIVSEGGAAVDMDGEADLSWPDALSATFTGEPGSGELLVDATLSAVTSFKFDLFGYTYESELDRRGIGVEGEGDFDPFLLDGSATESVTVATVGRSTELVTYELDVFAGVSVDFEATMTPGGSTTFSGVSFWVDEGQVTMEGESASVTPTGDVLQQVEATFVGAWQSLLELNITPAASVCFPIYGCEEIVSFDIPLTLASDDFEQAFPAAELEFPLPMLETTVDSYDFGEVEVGRLVNLELPISNVGLLDLQGDIGMTGSTYYSIFPLAFYAAPAMEDGVVLTFAPESEGEFSGTILLSSNDPWQPVVEIAIIGTGVLPDEGEDDTGVPYESDGKQVNTCGCASTGRGLSGGFTVALLATLLARRRSARANLIV